MALLLLPREPRHLGQAEASVAKQNYKKPPVVIGVGRSVLGPYRTGGVLERSDEKTVKKDKNEGMGNKREG